MTRIPSWLSDRREQLSTWWQIRAQFSAPMRMVSPRRRRAHRYASEVDMDAVLERLALEKLTRDLRRDWFRRATGRLPAGVRDQALKQLEQTPDHVLREREAELLAWIHGDSNEAATPQGSDAKGGDCE
ncbi:hypothetical protein [Streptomyces palmae]|uniref:Uncharacterized protein n=1 Tax=Streptomyces palmae TaxID=1701085 RepID=A0A4Z0HCT0_9ACTN|nr:hypothetical protein [Streptomyces palmae]TGB14959.1 hypothetical protein E4099_07575 [Streptomyces palmae]